VIDRLFIAILSLITVLSLITLLRLRILRSIRSTPNSFTLSSWYWVLKPTLLLNWFFIDRSMRRRTLGTQIRNKWLSIVWRPVWRPYSALSAPHLMFIFFIATSWLLSESTTSILLSILASVLLHGIRLIVTRLSMWLLKIRAKLLVGSYLAFLAFPSIFLLCLWVRKIPVVYTTATGNPLQILKKTLELLSKSNF